MPRSIWSWLSTRQEIVNRMDIISLVGTYSAETSLHASVPLTRLLCVVASPYPDNSGYAWQDKRDFVSLRARSLKMMRVVSSNCHFRPCTIRLVRRCVCDMSTTYLLTDILKWLWQTCTPSPMHGNLLGASRRFAKQRSTEVESPPSMPWTEFFSENIIMQITHKIRKHVFEKRKYYIRCLKKISQKYDDNNRKKLYILNMTNVFYITSSFYNFSLKVLHLIIFLKHRKIISEC